MTERTNYEGLLTDEVFAAVRPLAYKLAKQSRGFFTADDLINDAVVRLLKWKEHTIKTSMIEVFSVTLQHLYVEWVQGTHGQKDEDSTFMSGQDQYMAGIAVEDCEGVKPLTVPDQSPRMAMLLDIERAIHTLNAKEQQILRWLYWDELEHQQIAERLGIVDRSFRRWLEFKLPKVLKRLRVQLTDYE